MIHMLDSTCRIESYKQADVPMEVKEGDTLNCINLQKLEIYSNGNKLGELRNKEVKASCHNSSQKSNKGVLIQNGMNVNEKVTENLNFNGSCEELNPAPRITKLEKRVDEIEKKYNSVLQVNCLLLIF